MTENLSILAKPTGKSVTVADLDIYAKQVHDEYAAFQELEQEATWRALRIGALLVMVKEQLPHGQFGRWAQQNVPFIAERTVRRFMALADQFRKDRQLGYEPIRLIADVADPEKPAKQAKEYVQLALDFIGGRSLTDLYVEYGIVKREAKPRGGAREGTHPDLTPEQKLARKIELARRLAFDAAQGFDDLCGKDLVTLLDDAALTACHQCIANAYHVFSNEIKGRKAGRKS